MLKRGYLSFVLFLFDYEFLDFFGIEKFLSMQDGNRVLVTRDQDMKTEIDIKLLDPGKGNVGDFIMIKT
jgi:hypothetical protein